MIGVDVAGDREVVAQDDRVAPFLGRPASDPVDPGPVALAEHPVDEPVIGGQVVLGQEADLEGGLGHARQARLVGRPGLLVEVAPEPVRDVVVGEPLLGDLGVAVVQPARLGLQLHQQRPIVGQCLAGIEFLAGIESADGCGHGGLLVDVARPVPGSKRRLMAIRVRPSVIADIAAPR